MKKPIVAIGIIGASLVALSGCKTGDPVVMKIAGRDVRLSEFEYLYHKNNTQQVQPQTLDEYVDMFVNYKLKVADAEAAGLDTTAAFRAEFNQFRNELADPYLIDKDVQDSLVAQAYHHMTNDVYVSHIMMDFSSEAKLDSLRSAIVDGKTTFDQVARQYSMDRPSANRGGEMGWVGYSRYPWEFEAAAFATPVGQISPVINSGYGYHIIRTDRVQPSRGEVNASHILLVTRNQPDSVAAKAAVLIDSLYNVAVAAPDQFAALASTYSQDPGSARNGGNLGWFGGGQMVAEFDSAAFATEVGEISRPFRTSFGWHIIHKLDARKPATLEESRQQILTAIQGSERGTLPRRAYAAKMVKKYKGRVLLKNMPAVERRAAELGGKFDSTLVADFAKWNLPVFEINGRKYTVAEVMPRVPVNALEGPERVAGAIQDAAGLMLGDIALDLAREDLAQTNPEYRNLVNEYRDGILLFEVSNRNVWQRAAENPAELEAFFAANRDRYAWDGPKFKSMVIFASTDSLLQEAVAYAASLPASLAPTAVAQQVRDKFGRDVKVERVIAAKGENAITDFLAFDGPKPDSSTSRWPFYTAFRGRLINAPEEAADVRGQVVTDFQAELEKNWVNSLRSRFPVSVKKDALNRLK